MTILLRQPWEELVPWPPWHWSKNVKFRPLWLFQKGCLSLHSCQTAILPHVGTLNSAYWTFSTFQSAFISAIALYSCSMKFFLGLALGESCVACARRERHWCPQRPASMGRLSWANLGLVPWEWTPWHWSKHVKFRPSWLFQKGCLSLHSCQTAILPHVGTLTSAYWAFSTFLSAFISAIALVVLWYSFLGWPWANLALLAQGEKSTDVYKGLLLWEGFPGQTWSLCHGNEHHGIDPNMSNSGHHDCSRKAVFLCTAVKLQSCHMSTGRNSLFGEYAITKSRWSPISYEGFVVCNINIEAEPYNLHCGITRIAHVQENADMVLLLVPLHYSYYKRPWKHKSSGWKSETRNKG